MKNNKLSRDRHAGKKWGEMSEIKREIWKNHGAGGGGQKSVFFFSGEQSKKWLKSEFRA